MKCNKGDIVRSGYYRKAYRRSDGVRVKGAYVSPVCIKNRGAPGKQKGWMQSVNKEMEKRGTVGVFTRAKLNAGYSNTPAGTVRFANAVLANKIPGKTSAKWHDRAGLAKVFVRESRKR